ncbi:MAG: hypothetical protein F2681_10830 [Actinobacteria bacterium]|nr:hypothetical protein [Actinomycetota bacterium]MSW77218.1 hypothetical protein [Actinomycetota bacterium]MSX54278.1 hypothetical protein [Actinomycetota bacterium]MSZ83621.1 hypothetical protein [Actinomycetota bacterium]MTB17382.1 hypothetical protein [Actinomycetota bacterium]
MIRRFLRMSMITALVIFMAPPAAALADAPGPTDYRSSVIAIDPPTDTIHPSVIGGDSFLLLQVDAGTTVVVYGYQGEQYLRYEGDGTVFENQSSPTFALSGSRYGGSLPAGFDEHAPEDWHSVASDGRYAWHDHRIHWMANVRPPGKRPGDVVLRSQLRMTVDQIDVKVTVESIWNPAASRLPVWFGAAGGFAVALLVGLVRRSRWPEAGLALIAGVATIVGWWQYASLPTSTGPKVVWFLMPLAATLATTAMVFIRSMLTKAALLTIAGVNLFLWGWLRRDGFTHALLPNDAPGWFDRAVSAAAIASGPVAAAFGLAALALAVVAPARGATSAT